MSERVVVLTILKIFNWSLNQPNPLFEFTFLSLKTNTTILTKSIKASTQQQQVIFNYSLRVAYQSDENQILIKIAQLQGKSVKYDLAQIVLNLDHLASKKLQFFPFGKNDKVLKIAAGQPGRSQMGASKIATKNNEKFIKQKQDFLRRIGSANSNSRLKWQTSSVKSFSQQARDLISEIRQAKNKNQRQQQFNDYYEAGHGYTNNSTHQYASNSLKMMSKSNSASHLVPHLSSHLKTQRLTHNTKVKQFDDDSSNRSNKSQKHKLVLKNLQMVPCQNQYYQEVENKGGRKSDMMGVSSLNKKRLIRSQLY